MPDEQVPDEPETEIKTTKYTRRSFLPALATLVGGTMLGWKIKGDLSDGNTVEEVRRTTNILNRKHEDETAGRKRWARGKLDYLGNEDRILARLVENIRAGVNTAATKEENEQILNRFAAALANILTDRRFSTETYVEPRRYPNEPVDGFPTGINQSLSSGQIRLALPKNIPAEAAKYKAAIEKGDEDELVNLIKSKLPHGNEVDEDIAAEQEQLRADVLDELDQFSRGILSESAER